MSVEHHIRKSKRRERRRFVVDIVLVLFFLTAIFGIFFAHWSTNKYEESIRSRNDALIEESRAKAEQLAENQKILERELLAARTRELALGADASSSAPLLSAESNTLNDVFDQSLLYASTSADIASSKDGIKGYVHFEDVTSMRIENKRLGFLMEIPQDWSMAFERSDSIAYASLPYYFGVTVNEIARKDGAMWFRVIRPCSSTEATTTVFQFASSDGGGLDIREATACIAPFLVTVGYRADAPDRLGRELFLLSIARTFYPIVSPTAPYTPIQ